MRRSRVDFCLIVVMTFLLLSGWTALAQSGLDIPTWQVDTKHTGVNAGETTLTPGFVSTPGNLTVLYTEKVDGQVFAQPLFLSAATTQKVPGNWADGNQHKDVVFVVTENATLYAFDGDQEPNYKANTGFSNPIWSLHLVPAGNTTAVAIPKIDTSAANDIFPLLGVTETPVIDTVNGIIYVVSSLKDTGTLPASHPYEQLLWAINVKSGQPVNGSPVVVNPQFNGVFTGDNNATCTNANYQANTPNDTGCELDQEPTAPAGTIPFYPLHSHLRTALTLDNFNGHNTLYLTYASHSDGTPYAGFIVGYDATTLAQTTEFVTVPDNTSEAGIWMSGASPAIDPNLNKMYVITGNGANWDNKNSNGTPLPPMGQDSQGKVFSEGTNWPMSVLAFDTTPNGTVSYRNRNELIVPFSDAATWFTPAQWDSFNNGDQDLGAGGPLLLDTPAPDGSTKHLLMGGGKAGVMYVLDRTNLGGIDTSQGGTYSRNIPTTYMDDNVVQELTFADSPGFFNTPAFFNNRVYFSGGKFGVRSRGVGYNQNTNTYISSTEDGSPEGPVDKNAGVFISANGTSNGLVWQAANGIRAWDATNLAQGAIYSQVNIKTDDGSGSTCNTATFSMTIVSNSKIFFTCYQTPATTGTYTQANGTKATFTQPSDNRPGYLFVYGPAPVPEGAPSQVPLNATAQATSESQITVSWTYPSQSGSTSAATGFNVYRATCPTCVPTAKPINGSPIQQSVFSFVDTGVGTYTNANGSTFTMNGLSPNTTYYYTVKATNSAGQSNASQIASATTLPLYSEPGLVAYWPFDEGILQGANATSSTDLTGNSHTAVKDTSGGQDEIESSPSGYVGGSWLYHGTTVIDRLVVKNAADLQFTAAQSFSLVTWVNPTTLQGFSGAGTTQGYDGASIIVKSRDQGSYYGLWINLSGQWEARGPQGVLTGPAAVAGSWTQLALVQDGPNHKRYLYVNGKLAATGAAQDASGSGDLWFGQQNLYGSDKANQTMTDGFQGNIDETRIYNTIVTPAQLLNQAADPGFAAISLQRHGNGNVIGLPVYPFGVPGVPATEARVNPNQTYTLQLNFSQPLSATPTVTLQAQSASTQPVQGSVQSTTLDSSGMVLTAVLQNVANAQALDLHLTGLTSEASQNATYDLLFNVFNGDVSGDHQVNTVDANAISAQITNNKNSPVTAINASNAMFDLNLDGRIDSNDVGLATSLAGTKWTTPVETELSAFQVSQASNVSSQNPRNLAANAFDNNLGTTWESVRPSNGNASSGVAGVDPGWIYVDLGAPATVDGFTIYWDNAAASQYTIEYCNTLLNTTAGTCADTPSTSSTSCTSDGGWHTIACETNNAAGSTKTYRGLTPITARYFKVNGTVRTQAAYAYQLSEFLVFGQPGSPATASTPSLTAPVVSQPTATTTQVNLTWSASNNATTYSVFRGTSSGAESATALGTASTTSFSDTTGANGTTYFYYVTASASGYTTSGASNEVQVATPPAVPSMAQPVVSNGAIALSWNAVTGAGSYTVYRGTRSGSETSLASSQTTSYNDSSNLAGGTTYFYYVVANSTGTTVSPQSNEVQATTQLSTPMLSQPTVSGSQVALSWSSVINATGYSVYRGTSSGSETMLASAPYPSYTDTNLTTGTTYFYYVVATGSGGTGSGKSNEQSVPYTAPIAAPGSFTLNTPVAGTNSVSLSWSASPGANSYQVSRGTSAGNETTQLTPTTNSLSFTDSTVSGGTQFFYKVVASNAGTATTASNEVSITTQSATPPAGSPTTGTPIYQINAGSGTAVGSFTGDEFYSSNSSTSSSSNSITVPSGDSAAQSVYQTNRYGNFSYSFPSLTANATYTLVLHFAETYSGTAAVGKRVFSVTSNGSSISCPSGDGGLTNCLNNLDIYARAGYNTALVISVPVTADGNGNLKIAFTPTANNAIVNGIELLTNNSNLPVPAAPINLNAQGGNSQNTLSWNGGAGPIGTYSVYRGTAKGSETLLPNASNLTSSFFLDNKTLQNGTTYWYKVVATNGAGSNFSETSVTTGVPVQGTAVVRMAAGSTASIADPATGIAFTPDTFGKSGASTNANPINISNVTQAAPMAVYQNEHSSGSFAYTFNTANGLKPNTASTVRLHFAETYFPGAGRRLFNVSCGSFQLNNFDIYAASGGKNIAIIEQFTATTDANGTLTINFSSGSADQPKIDGIEIYQ